MHWSKLIDIFAIKRDKKIIENLTKIFVLNIIKIKLKEEIIKLKIIALDSILIIIIDVNKKSIGMFQSFLYLNSPNKENNIAIPANNDVTKKLEKKIELNAPDLS